MSRRLAIAVLLAAALVASATHAQTSEPENWAYAYFGEVMSPFCPGRTLSACTSGQAENLRMWILVQAAAGRSRDDVHEELLAKWGDVLLAAPRPQGFGLTAYALPAAIFLVGGGIVVIFLRRQTRSRAEVAASPPPPPLDPEIERLIDDELAR